MDYSTQQLGTKLIAFRQELHRFPELSNQEFETTQRIRRQLEDYQIRTIDLPLSTGVVAEIGPQDGPLIVLRGDIDALPIEEQSGVSYRSQHPGVMHACGHDFHSAAVLGAAILLKQHESQLPGRVRILFQAAEETGQGAPEVIATGALSDVIAIFGIHNDPSLPAGVIGCKGGALTAAVDRFTVKITGIGSHAAKPHLSNDPIIIAAQLITAAQTLISRNAPSADNAVFSITQVHSGSTWNVIPEEAWFEGTMRSFSQTTREQLEVRFRQLIDGLASAYQCKIELEWVAGPPSVVNDEKWAAFALQQAREQGLTAQVVEASPIGEDFAFYQQQIPGAFMMIGTGQDYALHHPAFRINDEVLLPTAYYLAQLAIAALTEVK